ncbi:prephenate dehydrogenase/arogenate dehydrogenase family protein [Acidipila sp. EB88]|uniref:prephenate dehydrogenase n=1 Tax=Acidipila sp. EB88 TaxID=2305226 RepID=UPI000F5DAB2D|nr:prephenate dehydrogenase/arogenate dehydrogenase family protein [Acidipila sp. EB88]RRA48053.1 prephenate dehydrogenase/arogenate dehydrogenase family protein [Acidipila sp. EB88]
MQLHSNVVAELGSGIRRVAIFGTGLIGTSIGLALREGGFTGSILGWDPDPAALAAARARGGVDPAVVGEPDEDPFVCALAADLIVLAGPVFSIAEWLEQLAPVLSPSQLVTDVGSVKRFLVEQVGSLYNGEAQPSWLPGHPMAGKEQGGAAHAEASLFVDSTWLFTGANQDAPETLTQHPYAAEWLALVERFGARTVTLSPARHDLLCASISHLPQMVATAFAAMLQQQFSHEFAGKDNALMGMGGRALREMTRLGASPYSMWRDIALANEPAVAAAMLALEQELIHLRENLKTPELREMFVQANAFRVALSEADARRHA